MHNYLHINRVIEKLVIGIIENITIRRKMEGCQSPVYWRCLESRWWSKQPTGERSPHLPPLVWYLNPNNVITSVIIGRQLNIGLSDLSAKQGRLIPGASSSLASSANMKEIIINVIDFVLYLRKKNQTTCSDTQLIYFIIERYPLTFDEVSHIMNEHYKDVGILQ